MRGLSVGPTTKFAQQRAKLRLAPPQYGSENHPASRAKEFPPKLPRSFQSFGTKWLDMKSAARQKRSRPIHRRPGFFRDRSAPIVFKEPDVEAPDQLFVNLTHRDWRGTRIARRMIAIRMFTVTPARHHLKKRLQVFDRARHRPNHSDQGKRPTTFRKVSGRRNAPRSRLQSANAAEVRRFADRAPAVAAHAASRKSRGDGGSFSATRSARGA